MCKYCDENWQAREDYELTKDYGSCSINISEGYMSVSFYGVYDPFDKKLGVGGCIPIQYCPFCGRKLNDE